MNEPTKPTVSATTAILIRMLEQRDAVGLEKYGTTLDRGDLSLAEWLQHQTEELLDAAGYAQAALRALRSVNVAASLDSPGFTPVAWFDTRASRVILSREDAERAMTTYDRVVLPVRYIGDPVPVAPDEVTSCDVMVAPGQTFPAGSKLSAIVAVIRATQHDADEYGEPVRFDTEPAELGRPIQMVEGEAHVGPGWDVRIVGEPKITPPAVPCPVCGGEAAHAYDTIRRIAILPEPADGDWNWIAADDVHRLTRQLDVALNGEDRAAPQASLCDIVGQVMEISRRMGSPLLSVVSAPVLSVPQARAAYIAACARPDEAARQRAWRDLQVAIARAGCSECGGAR